MKNQKKTQGKQYAVLGLGRFGRSVMETLIKNGCDVLACDNNEAIIHEVASSATHVVNMDIADEKNLESIGIGNFDVVIIAIGMDLETTIMAAMIVKEKGANYVIAKAAGQRQKKILESIGVDKVVLPEFEMGEKTAASLISGSLIDYMNISEECSIAEISPIREWVGKTLASARIRAESSINVVAIRRGNNTIVTPVPSESILENDILVVIGGNESIKAVTRRS